MNTTKMMVTVGFPAVLGIAVMAGCGQQPAQQTEDGAPAPQMKAPEGTESRGEKKGPSTRLEFSSKQEASNGAQPDIWTLKIVDAKSGQPVTDFEVVHDKLMHLIVVKRDLSWFNHIHPEYKGNGVFVVSTKLPSGGSYKIYADYTPRGGTQEVPQHELTAEGTSRISPKLTADKMQGAWMTKKVVAHPEGGPDKKSGATYEVALMPMPMDLKANQEAMLHFQVRDAKGKPIKDLQPYLGAMGHCVIVSSDTKQYLHSHPMEDGAKHDMSKMDEAKQSAPLKSGGPAKSGGPDVMFHTTFSAAGLYKAWGQFLHKGQVITAAFVVSVGPGATDTAEHQHDESQPHEH